MEGLSGGVEEEGGFLGEVEEFGTAVFEVVVEPMEGSFAEREVAVFATFALADDDDLAVLLEVVEGEGSRFVATNASGVEDFEESFVADSGRRGEVGKSEDGFDFGDGEEGFGETLSEFGEVEVGGRVGGKNVLFTEPGEEGADLNEAVVLHVEGERFPFGCAVVEEVTLIAFEDFLGDGRRVLEVAVFTPSEEVAEGFAAEGDSARSVVGESHPLEVIVDCLSHELRFVWWLMSRCAFGRSREVEKRVSCSKGLRFAGVVWRRGAKKGFSPMK